MRQAVPSGNFVTASSTMSSVSCSAVNRQPAYVLSLAIVVKADTSDGTF